MKQQIFSTAAELKAEYNQKREKTKTEWNSYNLGLAIESLSQAIADLRAIGINVHLDLAGNATEDAFLMVQTVAESKGMIVPISGILKIDNVEHLLCVSVSEADIPVLKIYLSQFDYRGQRIYPVIRGKAFDLNADPQAMHKFQQQVIFAAARNEIVRRHDVADVFSKDFPVKLDKNPGL